MNKKYKLAILATHPIQNQVPLFRKLAQHPQIDVMVYFCSTDFGITEKKDSGFGVAFKWDVTLSEGYPYKLLKNLSPSWLEKGPFRLVNPGIVTELIRGGYDALVIQGYVIATDWIALLGGLVSKTPVIFRGETVLTENLSVWKRALKWAALSLFFNRVNAFLPIGSKSREFYIHYGIPEDRMFLVPYIVDNEFFLKRAEIERSRAVETRKEIGVPSGLPVILYASKFIERKRPFDLLMAFERINRPAGLLFVGDGELRRSMELYVKEKNLKNVFFLGFKNQSELPRYYAAADIFVLPSAFEPWGLVINEAMCFGLPIVTTEGVAAATDLVRQDENGLVYPVGDITGLADILTCLIENPEKAKAMGMNSTEIITSWDDNLCVSGILRALEFVSNRYLPEAHRSPVGLKD